MSGTIIGTQQANSAKDLQPSHPQSSEPDAMSSELTPDGPPQRADAAETKPRRPRGFAAMDRRLVSEIARKGGRAAHSAGTAHEFTSDEARTAGQKGGRATHAKRRVSADTQEESPI